MTFPITHETELRLDAIETWVRAAREGRTPLSLALVGIIGMVANIQRLHDGDET